MFAFKIWWILHKKEILRYGVPVCLILMAGVAISLAYPVVSHHIQPCGGWFRKPCAACPELDAAVKARAEGRYAEVARMVEAGLSAHPDRSCWRDFEAQFDADLSLKVRTQYLPGRKGAASAPQALRFSTKDPYYLLVNPSARAYVYLFQVDAAGNLSAVFPNPDNTESRNPLPPGEQRIPGLTRFLTVGSQAGHEQLYLIAANWEIPQLERLAVAAAKAKGDRRRLLAKELVARTEVEAKYSAPTRGRSRFHSWDIESLGALPQVAEK